MIYTPEEYKIKDESMKPFIDSQEILDILKNTTSEKEKVKGIIAKSLNKKRLSLQETAALINTTDPELIDAIKAGAKEIKDRIYGDRIVLFAPLYIGNKCTNDCEYCGFRVTNKEQKRVTLSGKEISEEVKMLEDNGHKRLILVYGEHRDYGPEFIAETVKEVYKVKSGHGEIRRVNVNAAPQSIEGFKTIKDSEIGTYQVFQETYHPETYAKVHPAGRKSNYDNRLTALDRAMEAGIDDVGIGALFGLYDWRYELLALLRHVNHFEAVYKVGPHTISFPRIQSASGMKISEEYFVSDEDFVKLVAILRLAVPYTGMILTAREPEHIRKEVITYGISQIDGGTNIQMKGNSDKTEKPQDLDTEQFEIMDNRSLAQVVDELIDTGNLPSFCTACYRLGRTGEHFMEFSVPGFIKRFCGPNAMLTLAEYLEDYAEDSVKEKGYKSIFKKLEEGKDFRKEKIIEKIRKIQKGERDLYF